MARPSTIHALKERKADLDAALTRGEPMPALARQFGVSHDALKRYRRGEFSQQNSAPPQSQTAQRSPEEATARKRVVTAINKLPANPDLPDDDLDALTELKRLYRQGQELMTQAMKHAQFSPAATAIGRLTKVLEVHAKLIGDLQAGTVINNTTVTINEVSNQVQQVALNFQDAPSEVRIWAAKNILAQADV